RRDPDAGRHRGRTGVLGGVPLHTAALAARRAVAVGHHPARRAADPSGEGGAGGAAVPPPRLGNGAVRLRRLLWPGVMALAMLTVLVGLGNWQLRRLHWKEDLLAQIARAEAEPAVPLPPAPEAFAKVQVSGRLRADLGASYGAEVRDTPAGTLLGTQLIE